MSEEAVADSIGPEIRQVVEARYRLAVFRIFVCAEDDGEKCEPSLHPNGVRHRCAADATPGRATVVYVEAEPRRQGKG